MNYTDEEIEWINRLETILCPQCRIPAPQIVFWCGDMIGPRSRLKCDCGCIWNQDWENQKIIYIGPSAAEQYEKQSQFVPHVLKRFSLTGAFKLRKTHWGERFMPSDQRTLLRQLESEP